MEGEGVKEGFAEETIGKDEKTEKWGEKQTMGRWERGRKGERGGYGS